MRVVAAPVAAFVAALLAGCAAGPDFRRPAAPATGSYTPGALAGETAAAPVGGGDSQRFVAGADIPSEWWALFRSEPLDRLIRQALADSPTLVAARATLRIAEEDRRAQFGALLPSVTGGASAARQKASGASLGRAGAGSSTFTLYDASVNVSYALDLFGGTRRELEALQAQVDYQGFQLEGARLALTANLVTAAVREASLRAQLAATREIAAAEERQLDLVEQRFRLGGASRPDVLAQQAQLAQTRAGLPALERDLARTRHRLAVLAGRFPGDAGTVPEFDLDALELPRDLPVTLPSSLVRQRPDIRAAEEVLHAASARIGVATANLYPQVTLSGRVGSEAARLGDLFGAGSSVWALAAGALQPLFRGGELAAKRRGAIAAYDQAEANYREIVLLAFLDVADVLRALETGASSLKAQAEAEAAARSSLDLAREQFRLGAANYLSLLNAERQHQQARIGLVQARAARFSDTAALFQALGGGWGGREPGPGARTTTKDG